VSPKEGEGFFVSPSSFLAHLALYKEDYPPGKLREKLWEKLWEKLRKKQPVKPQEKLAPVELPVEQPVGLPPMQQRPSNGSC